VDHIADHFPEQDADAGELESYPHFLEMDEAEELASMYAVDNEPMAVCEESFNLTHQEFLDFRRAHALRHNQPTSVDPEKTIEESVGELTQRQRQQAVERKAKRRQKREKRKAAANWWRIEESLQEAAQAFREEAYEPPRLQVTLSETPPAAGSVVANAQDYHIAKRPASAPDDWSVSDYCDRLVGAFERGLGQAARNAQLDRVYLVIGGDLVHVDTAGGTTTAGTPQDLAVGPTEALTESIDTMVRHVDLTRQVASEVRLVGLTGNHDKVLSQACFEAVRQRFHSAQDVSVAGTGERIYDCYGDRLLAFTHGDMKKKVFRKIGDTITAEARGMMGDTRDTTLFTGHYHFKARDVIDESGRLQLQAPSPSPDDEYHVGEGYVGARKQIQLYLTRPDTQDDMTIGVSLS